MIKLFIAGTTRAMPPCMLLEEAGADYELSVIDLRRKERPDDLLALNPQGRVPFLIDGGLAIDQSVAILIYLADKFGMLLPKAEPGRSETLRYLLLAATDVMFGHSAIFRLLRRDEGSFATLIRDYRQRLLGDLSRCNDLLAHRDYLAGDISIADLMLYAIAGQYDRRAIERSGFHALSDWIERIRMRSAIRAAESKCPYAYDVSDTLGDEVFDPEHAAEGLRPVA